jgi:hypothetical protein
MRRGNEGELAARVTANPADVAALLPLAGASAARKARREAMDKLQDALLNPASWRRSARV